MIIMIVQLSNVIHSWMVRQPLKNVGSSFASLSLSIRATSAIPLVTWIIESLGERLTKIRPGNNNGALLRVDAVLGKSLTTAQHVGACVVNKDPMNI